MSAARLWLMAARPRTLPAAVAPVLGGTAAAVEVSHEIRVGAFIAALVGSIFIQIGTNLANDYSDARRGADTADRLGAARGAPPRRRHGGPAGARAGDLVGPRGPHAGVDRDLDRVRRRGRRRDLPGDRRRGG